LNSWGGFPRADGTDTKQCNRGGKAFCCMSGMFESVVKGCSWKKRLVILCLDGELCAYRMKLR
jgi:hypothetical protein